MSRFVEPGWKSLQVRRASRMKSFPPNRHRRRRRGGSQEKVAHRDVEHKGQVAARSPSTSPAQRIPIRYPKEEQWPPDYPKHLDQPTTRPKPREERRVGKEQGQQS